VPRYDEIRRDISSRYPEAPPKIVFQETLRRLVDLLVSGLIEGTREEALAAGVTNWEDVCAYPHRLARISAAASDTNVALKAFLRQNMYYTSTLTAERDIASRHVAELFQYYVGRPEALPENYRLEAESTPVHRVVCDYIAGMTDGYFRRTYSQVLGGTPA